MSSLRESLASIPGALSNFISESATNLRSATPSTNDDGTPHSEKSFPIPASLVKEQWRLIFTSDANAQDLEAAIAHCRDLVLLTDECSEERRWLVRHLVDLRYSLKELQDAEADPFECLTAVKTVVGHHFTVHKRDVSLQAATKRHYCDHCTGIVWSVVQQSYICTDCGYLAHQKCVDSVVRVCAHVIASERQYPIADICPEIGLAAQHYKCAECRAMLNSTLPATVRCFGQKSKNESSWIEPRLCDYNGLYYCPTCHWNDNCVVPARVVHNWDFVPRKVSRASLQEIRLFLDKPLIKLEEANPKLFVFLQKLCAVKKLRQNLVYMRKYLAECRQAIDEKFLDTQIGCRRHLVQSNDFYSINDLEQTESGALLEFLHKLYAACDRHIRQCSMCTARAYICEICGNDEVIFPFDDGCILCDKCNSIYHRVCMTRKNMTCPKCVRLQERKLLADAIQTSNDDDTSQDHDHNDNDDDDGGGDGGGDDGGGVGVGGGIGVGGGVGGVGDKRNDDDN